MTLILYTFLGTMSIAAGMGVKKKYIAICGVGGVLTWFLCKVGENILYERIIGVLVSSFCITIYSEILARALKTPTTVFLSPAIVPILPGRSLFYSIKNLISRDFNIAFDMGFNTLMTSCAISMGIVLASAIVTLLESVFKRVKKMHPKYWKFRAHYNFFI